MVNSNKAVFFDRDGVLNHLIERDGSFYSPQCFDDFEVNADAIKIIQQIKELGFLAIVISNQPDITRGKLEQHEMDKMTQVLFSELKIDDVFYCTHDDNNDIGCRKPKPGLFHLAQQKYNINFNHSIMVGDTWKDVDAARNAKIKMYLLDKNYNQEIQNVERIQNLSEVLSKLNGLHK